MFSPNPKNDPLLSAIKGVIAENDKHRDAVDRANKHFKITDKRQLPHNLHADYDKMLSESTVIAEKITKSTPMGDVIRDFEKSDAPQFEGKSMEKRRQMAIAAKMSMNEALKGNQHKIDANKNGKVDAQDFKMLRKMDEDVMTEAINNILEQDSFTTAEYNTLMESPFGDAFKAARASGSAEFTFRGKQYNSRQADETEDQWKANLEKNAPVPMPRNARPVSTPEPVANVDPAPAPAGVKPVDKTTNMGIPRSVPIEPGSAGVDGARKYVPTPLGYDPFPSDKPKAVVPPVTPNQTSMVAGQTVRNDNTSQLPTQVTQPSTVRGYGNDSLSTTIKSMYADRIRR